MSKIMIEILRHNTPHSKSSNETVQSLTSCLISHNLIISELEVNLLLVLIQEEILCNRVFTRQRLQLGTSYLDVITTRLLSRNKL